MALADMHGTATFMGSASAAPDGGAKASEEKSTGASKEAAASREEPVKAQVKAPTAGSSLGNELHIVVEETSEQADNSLKIAGGLDLAEQVPTGDDLQDYGRRNSLEYDNFGENDYAAPGDDGAGGDIINPMEGAEYYQGSFHEDADFAEYRSQGSNEDLGGVQQATAEVEVQDVDEDLLDDAKQRKSSADYSKISVDLAELSNGNGPPGAMTTGTAGRGGPAFVTPRTALQIKVGGEEEEDEDGLDQYPGMNAEMAEQVDNPYLLHYKNKSQMLKQELMGQPSTPVTPNLDR